ncbi:MAG: multidrug efflux SMR transporter [Candidatus Obscuribacter sp.]|jgi:quaternary ammonium compound-resistance protein SugE|nr:multidrug efflux SMR transporter [Candidatus Obscuribacter sp.]MDQ5965144.1 quaternary ammonium compound-resistance protein SugE [Cyanobacteriota bacterium erpe_2018_sw_39hr_WHONDRS-SW48-000098_B_bin.30]MBK9201038.1 multidrug efflux SMR transporter [Candidatus Obscuribacter sp.]MBK9621707.1 multidrug efflux SMR transporter [Candidatus Obscuribacter sp.]MBK9774731.1 multidrug efflux SMR transporter [Candidatus Obscuribacter sp.]
MSWSILLLAGLFEIVWAALLKVAATKQSWTVGSVTILTMVASIWLLSQAMKQIPLGTAYAVWTGIGAVGAFVVGVVCFAETVTAGRLISFVLLVAGLIGLKCTTKL